MANMNVHNQTNGVDPLAKGMTRLPIFIGAPFGFILVNASVSFLFAMFGLMLSDNNIIYIFYGTLMFVVVHLVCAKLCFKDERGLDLLFVKLAKCPNVPNYAFWGNTNSYSAQDVVKENRSLAGSILLRREKEISQHIPYTHHIDANTVMTKNGDILQIMVLEGYDFDTKDWDELVYQKNTLNTLWRGIADSDIAIYFHVLRRKHTPYPDGTFTNPYAKHLNEQYKVQIAKRQFYQNRLYISIVKKRGKKKINSFSSLLASVFTKSDQKAHAIWQAKAVKELNKLSERCLSVLKNYSPRLLGIIDNKSFKISEPVTFFSDIMNLDQKARRLPLSNIASYLPIKRLSFARRKGLIQCKDVLGNNQYGIVLSIKEYPEYTNPGMLDTFLTLPCEFTITQSFLFEHKSKSQKDLTSQHNRLSQTDDKAETQKDEIYLAQNELASGRLAFGHHQLSVCCYADTVADVEKAAAKIHSVFVNLAITAVREDTGVEETFWSQLPGNFAYHYRKASISTKNLAAFASFHNFPQGKRTGNHWGNAVTVLETVSGSAFYFNFHVLDVANSIFIGPQGTGKTLLLGAFMAFTLKYPGWRVVFDKDRGMEILIRALGGDYYLLKPGHKTGLNPLQLDNTEENKKFLGLLLRRLLTTEANPLTADDTAIITRAINGLYELPKKERVFANLAPFFGPKKRGSLRNRLEQWVGDSEHAWLFDNAEDTFNVSNRIIGFDIGKLLKYPECCTPALMYIFHRIGLLLDGTPTAILIPEGWKPLSDPFFQEQMGDWSKTERKQNLFMAIDTQNPEELASSLAGRSIVQESVTQGFFANAGAQRKDYIEGFGLTEREYEIVKELPKESHYFLLKQGKQSVVVRLNLQGLDNEIPVISGRNSTVALLDKIRAEVGDDPALWLPEFYKRWRRVIA